MPCTDAPNWAICRANSTESTPEARLGGKCNVRGSTSRYSRVFTCEKHHTIMKALLRIFGESSGRSSEKLGGQSKSSGIFALTPSFRGLPCLIEMADRP